MGNYSQRGKTRRIEFHVRIGQLRLDSLLHKTQGMTNTAIAARLGVSESRVRQLLSECVDQTLPIPQQKRIAWQLALAEISRGHVPSENVYDRAISNHQQKIAELLDAKQRYIQHCRELGKQLDYQTELYKRELASRPRKAHKRSEATTTQRSRTSMDNTDIQGVLAKYSTSRTVSAGQDIELRR